MVATAKAPLEDILRFAAHHIDAGAALVHVFLDEANPAAFDALMSHPKCEVTVCNDAYWHSSLGARPEKVEQRQSANASRAYRIHQDIGWLMHADIDEFLVSDEPVAELLTSLPEDTDTFRARPMESLATSAESTPTAFKDFIPNDGSRGAKTQQIYPTYGAYINAGFLSHLGGKVFVRGGLPNVKFRIHNAFQNGEFMQREASCDSFRLAHLHATNWKDWSRALPFRLAHGAYRHGLKPVAHEEIGDISLNDLFNVLLEDGGVNGLCPFFDEVCADSQELRARLKAYGLLVLHDLDLDAKLARHFPEL
jgi:hypothetical protein